ncbi:hypothetical protein ACMBCM_02225 [Spiroplasma sp. K1]
MSLFILLVLTRWHSLPSESAKARISYIIKYLSIYLLRHPLHFEGERWRYVVCLIIDSCFFFLEPESFLSLHPHHFRSKRSVFKINSLAFWRA